MTLGAPVFTESFGFAEEFEKKKKENLFIYFRQAASCF